MRYATGLGAGKGAGGAMVFVPHTLSCRASLARFNVQVRQGVPRSLLGTDGIGRNVGSDIYLLLIALHFLELSETSMAELGVRSYGGNDPKRILLHLRCRTSLMRRQARVIVGLS